jgi:hypothetical protein
MYPGAMTRVPGLDQSDQHICSGHRVWIGLDSNSPTQILPPGQEIGSSNSVTAHAHLLPSLCDPDCSANKGTSSSAAIQVGYQYAQGNITADAEGLMIPASVSPDSNKVPF